MVVAEVPLWVVHSSDVSHGGLLSGQTPSKDSKAEHNLARARDSLSLLEGAGGTQKSAIYSLDVHPTEMKFATGGGDGTVRLWSANALFRSAAKPKSSYAKGGQYASSSGETSAEDEDESNDLSSRGSVEGDNIPEETEKIHDLNNLVRRKKGSTSKEKATTTTVPLSPPPKASQSSSPKAPSPIKVSKQGHHRLLCTLSAHTGSSVLAVRFSTTGKYLASAGDDTAVCIYTKATGHYQSNLENNSVEQWTRIKLCRGHGLDAVGLAWAPDDSHLVSCSLDSDTPIIVWKVTDLAMNERPTHANVICNPYKVLGKGIHTSTVKGVTFDPAGTYLASSGDDPSICVWRAHDDWGLERKIDANSGIFRSWKEGDAQALSSQTLFRRLSWSTDGAYICSTNSVVKNKHVASTVSRDGWAVSSNQSAGAGAANLVGHKQPVVVSRHCPILLDVSKDGFAGEDDEPEYATLLALGDKRGFVTVWSTRRSKPVFKLQCSEARCTVTDLAWGRMGKDVMLLVSLLDGQVVALRFNVPDELGNLLKPEDQAKVFQVRYGIDLNENSDLGQRRLFVGGDSGPKLIENALQYTLDDDDDEEDGGGAMGDGETEEENNSATNINMLQISKNQTESSKGGKKRVRPVLMNVDNPGPKRSKNGGATNIEKGNKQLDPLQDAMALADKATTGAAAVASQNAATRSRQETSEGGSLTPATVGNSHSLHSSQHGHAGHVPGLPAAAPQIPHSTARIHSVDLPIESSNDITMVGVMANETTKYVADCANSIQVPHGSKGGALPCTTLSISKAGRASWKDQIPGTSCSAIAASKHLLGVGTSDGTVQLYGTSPSMGWSSGTAFRSHPPLIFGAPIVSLQLHDSNDRDKDCDRASTTMLVVAADGSFGLYSLIPEFKKLQKGTIMSAMQHMVLASDMTREVPLPKLARLQITESKQLLLLLSLQNQANRALDNGAGRSSSQPSVGAGGSLQAFVYNEPAEIWMRVADSRFVLSDFYSTLPVSSKAPSGKNLELCALEDSVRMGNLSSSLKPSRRLTSSHADAAYRQTQDVSGDDIITRGHCEDRMACAIALRSPDEFEIWLKRYVQTLSKSGHEAMLRVLVDMILHEREENGDESNQSVSSCWWLTRAPKVLELDRVKLVGSVVIKEMQKNPGLQRLTFEIASEIESLR